MRALWAGDTPLVRAFWFHAILCGGLANLAASAAALVLLAMGAPTIIAVCVFLAPAPYMALATIGVWRSANRHPGSRRLAELAKVVAVVWAVGLLFI